MDDKKADPANANPPSAGDADEAWPPADLPRLALRALLGAFGAVAVWLTWVSLPWPLIHDTPILHYLAWRISEGAVPYRDLFDMNQPGAYLVHWAVLRLLGDGDFAWRLFDLVWLAAGALTIRAFAAPWGPIAGWGGALVFVVYHLGSGAWQAGQRDFVLVPFLVGGAHLVTRWLETRGSTTLLRPAIAGLALGAAVTIKPHVLLFAAALGATMVIAHRIPPRVRAVAATAFAVGLAVPPAVVLAWLAARGGLGAWWEVVTGYLIPLYSHLTRAEDATLYRRVHWVPLGAAVLVNLGSAFSAQRLTTRHAVAVLGIVYGIVHFVAQRKGWEYHLYPLAAFAAILVFAELEARLEERRPVVPVTLMAILTILVALLGVRGVEAASASWVWDKERLVRLLASDLSPRLRAGDTVQVLDTTEGGLHALLRLRRTQPTRFLYDFHFHHDADARTVRRLRTEFEEAMAARPPALVVVYEKAWPVGGYQRLVALPAFKRQLETDYVSVQARPWYTIFAKRDRP